MTTQLGNRFIKRMMTGIFLVLFAFAVGVYVDRWYILYKITDDIELNTKDEYRTLKNDEYTSKKIYTYNYIKELFDGNKNLK